MIRNIPIAGQRERHWWSPELHKAYMKVVYWKLVIAERRNGSDLTT